LEKSILCLRDYHILGRVRDRTLQSTALKALGVFDLWVPERALLDRLVTSKTITWGRLAPCTTHMRRVGHEVIHDF
jgi:hypothetical protein